MSDRPAVRLTHVPNGSGHDDLTLAVGRWTTVSDTYYYKLDRGVGVSLRRLLEQWHAWVDACPPWGTVYLPHAFFDESTGWLRCRRRGDRFLVDDGYTTAIEGHALYPSELGEPVTALEGWTVQPGFGEPAELGRDRLLADIRASLERL